MCDIIDHPDLFFFFDPVHPFLLCIEALVEDDPILFQPPLFRPSFSGFSYVCLLLLGCAPPFRKCEKPLRRLDAHFFAIVFSVCPFIVYESVRNCRQTIPVFENCEWKATPLFLAPLFACEKHCESQLARCCVMIAQRRNVIVGEQRSSRVSVAYVWPMCNNSFHLLVLFEHLFYSETDSCFDVVCAVCCVPKGCVARLYLKKGFEYLDSIWFLNFEVRHFAFVESMRRLISKAKCLSLWMFYDNCLAENSSTLADCPLSVPAFLQRVWPTFFLSFFSSQNDCKRGKKKYNCSEREAR